MGRPITLDQARSRSLRVTRWEVTWTVVSVMPYMLTSRGRSSPCASHHGRRSFTSSASPPKTTCRSARPSFPWTVGAHELAERGRRLAQHRDALLGEEPAERVGRAAHPVGDDDQPPAVEERAPDLPDGEVEGRGVEERPHVARVEAVPGARGLEEAHRVVVRDHHALGLAGRSGGVDHVGEVVGPEDRCPPTPRPLPPAAGGRGRRRRSLPLPSSLRSLPRRCGEGVGG